MGNLPLDYILSATTVVVLWLTGNKSIWAPIGGLINNVLWIGYAIYIHQYGLVIGSLCMGAMYIRALILWRRDERRQHERSKDEETRRESLKVAE